jgi:hypothetical protein
MARSNHDPADSPRRLIKLAQGIRLRRDGDSSAATLLVVTAGEVQLNQHALAILELCDGSRSVNQVVTDAILHSSGAMRATDVIDFLAAAQSRGWLIEEHP